MANYAIMRIEKRKLGSVTAICNHHERLKEKYKSNPDIDTERTHLNFHIVKPTGRYRQLVLERIDEAGAKRRKDSVVMQDCLVAASPDWIRAKSDEDQAEYFKYAFEFFEEKFRKENILSAVVHLDEANPHMHLCFVPLTEDNRLSSKEIIGGPKGLVKLQDDFHAHMEKKYPDLTRGISKTITHRKHLSTQMYKQANMLYEHYNEIVSAVRDIGFVNSSQKKDTAILLLGKYAPEMAEIKNQMKATDKYIRSLENEISVKKTSLAYKDNELKENEAELYELRSKVRELNHKQKQLQKQIDKIPPEVMAQMVEDEKQRRKQSRGR